MAHKYRLGATKVYRSHPLESGTSDNIMDQLPSHIRAAGMYVGHLRTPAYNSLLW
jgi:hypothetical protein